MRRLTLLPLVALVASGAKAQIVVPGRAAPPLLAPPPAALAIPAPVAADLLLARLLAESRTSPTERTPWGYGRCLFGLTLPDSLGLFAAPQGPAAVVAAGPRWVSAPLVAAPAVVPVRVVGALCADSTAPTPYLAAPHAVVEWRGRYALVPLREGAVRSDGDSTVRVDAPLWQQPLSLFENARPGGYVAGVPGSAPTDAGAAPLRVASSVTESAPPSSYSGPVTASAVPSVRSARARRAPVPRAARAATTTSAPRAYTPSGYIRGPRSGCYTYSASGRKRYVDRSPPSLPLRRFRPARTAVARLAASSSSHATETRS